VQSGPDLQLITPGSLSYPGLTSVGNSVVIPNGSANNGNMERLDLPETYFNYDTPTPSGNAPDGVYFSMLVNVAVQPGTDTSATYFAGFNYFTANQSAATSNGYGGMVYIRRDATNLDNYQLGIVKNNKPAGSVTVNGVPQSHPDPVIDWADGSFASGETVFLAGHYAFATRNNISDDTASIWINPALGAPAPAASAQSSTGADIYATTATTYFSNIKSFTVRSNTNAPGNITVDELRVGLSYADVVVPEPTTAALLGIAGLAALGQRRRRHVG
jgi:hypothetical protein